MDKILLKILRRVNDLDGLVDNIMKYTYLLYKKDGLKKMGFDRFSDKVIHYLWLDEISPMFEEYDEETDEFDVTISRIEVGELKEKLKNGFNNKMLEFYNKNTDDQLQETIKRFLKEETSLKSNMLDHIKKYGLIKTAYVMGGIKVLSKVLDKTPEMLLNKYMSKEIISTENTNVDVGGYNFKFRLVFVEKQNDIEHNFVYSIEEGMVDLVMVRDDNNEYEDFVYDLLGDEIQKLDYWWEIKSEIKDILYEFTQELIEKINLDVNEYKISLKNF